MGPIIFKLNSQREDFATSGGIYGVLRKIQKVDHPLTCNSSGLFLPIIHNFTSANGANLLHVLVLLLLLRLLRPLHWSLIRSECLG